VGEVIVDGVSLAKRSSDDLARYRRETIGFIFQAFYLIPHHTALERTSAQLPLALEGVGPFKTARPRARRFLARVGLEKRAHHSARPALGPASGSASRIARALAKRKPEGPLADEPTGNLDSRTADEILDLVVKTSTDPRPRTVVLVTHERDHARRYTRRLIRAAGRPDRLRRGGGGPPLRPRRRRALEDHGHARACPRNLRLPAACRTTLTVTGIAIGV